MMELNQLIEALHVDKVITLEDIPNVDLYVDQVVQLFENSYQMTTRKPDEKVLTKTMINNYAKGKLFFPIKSKKYTKHHIILISLIYQLKGSLSINDIKSVLDELNNKLITEEDFDLAALYTSFLHLTEKNVENFKEDIQKRLEEVKEETDVFEDEKLEQLLLVSSFVTISNLYRRLAEKIVDEMNDATKK
ncbi:DUF1836 domain-containing protein [Ectobacillus polymachus]|uniref:DUF1836 domain-containing protein n=1 Tax=Ectobacillus polymachus TaxID=1508806 RepID=UPI003A8AE302